MSDTAPSRQSHPPEHPPHARAGHRSGGSAGQLLLYLFVGLAVGSAAVLAAYSISPVTRDGSELQTSFSGASSTNTASRIYSRIAPGVVGVLAENTSESDPAGEPLRGVASGSGFVVDMSGRIATAYHVIDGSSKIQVTLSNGSRHRAWVVDANPRVDIAILKIKVVAADLVPLPLGSSHTLQTGTPVLAIGNPFGFSRSLTGGMVSGVRRTIRTPKGFVMRDAIQTDTALNPGSSGGPLLTMDGNVVGIVSQIATTVELQQSSGVGFAIPVEALRGELARER